MTRNRVTTIPSPTNNEPTKPSVSNAASKAVPATDTLSMPQPDDPLECTTCDALTDRADAVRRQTIGDLDPDKWQTLCCPSCGSRLKTVFVGA